MDDFNVIAASISLIIPCDKCHIHLYKNDIQRDPTHENIPSLYRRYYRIQDVVTIPSPRNPKTLFPGLDLSNLTGLDETSENTIGSIHMMFSFASIWSAVIPKRSRRERSTLYNTMSIY